MQVIASILSAKTSATSLLKGYETLLGFRISSLQIPLKKKIVSAMKGSERKKIPTYLVLFGFK